MKVRLIVECHVCDSDGEGLDVNLDDLCLEIKDVLNHERIAMMRTGAKHYQETRLCNVEVSTAS
jgi:hypothetical protein